MTLLKILAYPVLLVDVCADSLSFKDNDGTLLGERSRSGSPLVAVAEGSAGRVYCSLKARRQTAVKIYHEAEASLLMVEQEREGLELMRSKGAWSDQLLLPYATISDPESELISGVVMPKTWLGKDGFSLFADVFLSEEISDEIKNPLMKRTLWGLWHAVREMHNKGLVHRDLKPENFSITCKGTVCLLDFGFVAKDTLLKNSSGTMLYAAPETFGRITDNAYKLDVWSLGVMFLTAMTSSCFIGLLGDMCEETKQYTDFSETSYKTSTVGYTDILKELREHSDFKSVPAFVWAMLTVDSRSRLSLDELLKEPSFGSYFQPFFEDSRVSFSATELYSLSELLCSSFSDNHAVEVTYPTPFSSRTVVPKNMSGIKYGGLSFLQESRPSSRFIDSAPAIVQKNPWFARMKTAAERDLVRNPAQIILLRDPLEGVDSSRFLSLVETAVPSLPTRSSVAPCKAKRVVTPKAPKAPKAPKTKRTASPASQPKTRKPKQKKK